MRVSPKRDSLGEWVLVAKYLMVFSCLVVEEGLLLLFHVLFVFILAKSDCVMDAILMGSSRSILVRLFSRANTRVFYPFYCSPESGGAEKSFYY